jgi:hypothetical protein
MSVIQGVYIALFGRPADPGGLAYWTEVTHNGTDLSEMLRVLPSLDEYTERFAGQTPEEVITSVYQNLFGRSPDPEGLAFFQERLEAGDLNLANIAVGILQGAQGDDSADVQAKVDAAEMFTASLDTPEEIEAFQGVQASDAARAFLGNVDKDAPATQESVEGAIADVVAGQQPGNPDPEPVDPTEPVDPEPVPVSVTNRDATLSEIAIDDGGINMWKGRGNTAGHFSVTQVDLEDDAVFDVELALGLQYRNGIAPEGQSGIIGDDDGDGVYAFVPGEDVMFRFSVASLLDELDLSGLLERYDIKLFVDHNPAADVADFVELNLVATGGNLGSVNNGANDIDQYSGYAWDFPAYDERLVDDVGNPVDVPGRASVTQNVQAVQWYQPTVEGELFAQGYALADGEYELSLKLFEKGSGTAIAENNIVLVGTTGTPPAVDDLTT